MKTSFPWILCLLLLSLLLGCLPPGYAAFLGMAHQYGEISDASYQQASAALSALMLPGRTLLAPTPWKGALSTTHFPIWKGLFVFIASNSVGWAMILALGWFLLHKVVEVGHRSADT